MTFKARWSQGLLHEWVFDNVKFGKLDDVLFKRGRPSKSRKRFGDWLPKGVFLLPSYKGEPKGLPLPTPGSKEVGSWRFGFTSYEDLHRLVLLLIPDSGPVPEILTTDPPDFEIGRVFMYGRVFRARQEGNWMYVAIPKPFLQLMRRYYLMTPIVVPKGSPTDRVGIPGLAIAEDQKSRDPAVLVRTDGTNLLFVAAPYLEPGLYIPKGHGLV